MKDQSLNLSFKGLILGNLSKIHTLKLNQIDQCFELTLRYHCCHFQTNIKQLQLLFREKVTIIQQFLLHNLI